MQTIDRYLLRELLTFLGYCIFGMLLFWILFDLFQDIERFRDCSMIQVLHYYLVRLPEFLVTVIPIGLLLAVLYVLSNHVRHNELLALRAIGLNMSRISAPYYAVGLLCTAALYGLSECVVPSAVQKAEEMLAKDKTRLNQLRWARDVTFLNQLDQRTWHITLYDRKLHKMWGVLLEWSQQEGTVIRLGAVEASYTNGYWLFQKVKVLEFNPQAATQFHRYEKDYILWPEINEPPQVIESEIEFSRADPLSLLKNRKLTVRQLLFYLKLHPVLPRDLRAKLLTQLHVRLAEPWACVVVVAVAVPLAVRAGKKGAFAAVSISIVVVVSYFFVSRILTGFGTSGQLPPWLAAWSSNLVFMLSGLLLGLLPD